jgi:hypothetical protein
MADAVTTQILHESPSDLVVKFTNISDGTGEADVNKVDVSALTPAASRVILDEIIFATDGMAVRIEWDATTDVPAFLVPANQNGRLNFCNMGMASGIPNDAGSGITGDVFFTTVGHTSGDTYVIILVFRKIP